MLIRKKSKQVWILISEESKQSLGLGSKSVKMLQGVTHAVGTLDFINCDKAVSQSFRGREGTSHGDLFPIFKGTEESHRALPALTVPVIVVHNNQCAIVWGSLPEILQK